MIPVVRSRHGYRVNVSAHVVVFHGSRLARASLSRSSRNDLAEWASRTLYGRQFVETRRRSGGSRRGRIIPVRQVSLRYSLIDAHAKCNEAYIYAHPGLCAVYAWYFYNYDFLLFSLRIEKRSMKQSRTQVYILLGKMYRHAGEPKE